MNSLIETLNQWGGNFLGFAWPMFWQSSLLIAILFAFDFLFRRKIRAFVRYAFWLVVLVKLCVPPTLALPTSPAWWLHKTPQPIAAKPDAVHYSVTYDNAPPLEIPQTPSPVFVPPKPAMTLAAWLLVFSASISLVLLLWLLVRWRQITRQVCFAATSERLTALADEAQKITGMKLKVQVKLTTNSISPAVCGLFRPAILIPQSLADNFSDEQLRAVLLHELIHLRRRDMWVNFLQALLQIFYWWHPLAWLANACIRRVREEAVDDAVMLALRDEAESYASTLLEVAKLALNRPLASLGLVGIMESRHALRQRIERLVDFRPPRKAGLTLVSLLGIFAFTAIAVPMGEGPSPAEKQTLPVPPVLMSAFDALNTNADRATVIGILSNTNFRVVLHTLEQRTGIETLAEPKPAIMSSGDGINRITLTNISVPISNFVSASSSQSAVTNLSNTADNLDAKAKAGVLVQDGKLLYETGKLDEAEIKLKAALSLDSANAAAQYYLGLVQQARSGLMQKQTKSGRQIIMEKLDRIRLAKVSYGDNSAGMPLGDVIRDLFQQIKINDPDKQGINLIINPYPDREDAPFGSTTPGSAGPQAVDIGGILVKLALTDVRLADVLDALVKVAPEPIHYSVEDYAVVFRPGKLAEPFYMRQFKVDTNVFIVGLRNMPGLQSTNFSTMARNFFSTLGVDMDLPGKSVFFNHRLGLLLVKATESDLDMIEHAIQELDAVPPQVHIKARFLVVPEKVFQDLVMPNLPNVFTNSIIRAGTNVWPGLLTNEKFKTVLRALQREPGVITLAEPEATTISGRQILMRATQVISVITNFTVQETATNLALIPQTKKMETGPNLDTIPYVLSDDYTINLSVIPSLTEFLGYGLPNSTNAFETKAGKKVFLPKVMPNFTVRQYVATLNLWDGQTAVIGGLTSSSVLVTTDKVPILGDIPLIGKLFQSQSRTTNNKNVVVFITVTIVDSADNRIHSDDEMPFAKDGIPPQPPK
jgi:beta-lactamase regulating signal transducer with metallopeptidase domain/type II secretory pathway component GspD/PulD (secretin)